MAKLFENMGWLFFEKVLRMVVRLFVGIWVARYLGPEQFGRLSYAIAYVSLFGALAALGMSYEKIKVLDSTLSGIEPAHKLKIPIIGKKNSGLLPPLSFASAQTIANNTII